MLYKGLFSPHGFRHILNEDPVPSGGVVHQNVGDCAHKLAVLNDGGAGQECGQEGTTKFNGVL